MKNKPQHYTIPLALNTSEFKDLFDEYLEVRKAEKYPVNGSICRRLLNKLEGWGYNKALVALNNALMGGWRDVFDPGNEVDLSRMKLQQKRRTEKNARRVVLWSMCGFDKECNRKGFPDEWSEYLRLTEDIKKIDLELKEI